MICFEITRLGTDKLKHFTEISNLGEKHCTHHSTCQLKKGRLRKYWLYIIPNMGLSCNSSSVGMDFLHSFMSGLSQPACLWARVATVLTVIVYAFYNVIITDCTLLLNKPFQNFCLIRLRLKKIKNNLNFKLRWETLHTLDLTSQFKGPIIYIDCNSH